MTCAPAWIYICAVGSVTTVGWAGLGSGVGGGKRPSGLTRCARGATDSVVRVPHAVLEDRAQFSTLSGGARRDGRKPDAESDQAAILGLEGELVASDAEDYVAKAVRLATDKAFRGEVSARILERRERLFSDAAAAEVAAEWEGFVGAALRMLCDDPRQ